MASLYSVLNTSYDAESASLQRPIVSQLRWLTHFCLTIGDLKGVQSCLAPAMRRRDAFVSLPTRLKIIFIGRALGL